MSVLALCLAAAAPRLVVSPQLGHTSDVTSVATNGKVVLSGSFDHTVKLWDLASGREIVTLFGHTAPVSAVALLPDAERAVSASWDHRVIVWDLRTVTSQEADVFEARFREAAALRDAEIKRRFPEGGVAVLRRSNTPELKVDPESPAELFARAVTGDNQIRTVAYAAEAGLFQRAGIPAVICGPGSIEQAHQPNEWIERSQIEAGVAFMQRLIERLSV